MMVIGMNLQGYISSEDLQQWGEEKHPLYFPFFSRLAEEGAIFDAQSAWKSLIPVVLRALFVMQLNNKYRGIAEKLTEWENHETVSVIWPINTKTNNECYDTFHVFSRLLTLTTASYASGCCLRRSIRILFCFI